MARRSSIRQQAALKSVDYISSQYAVRNEMRRKEILQSAFEKREKSIDDMFAFATQALGVIDKMSAKKKQDVKIEKSVTSMAGKQGGEVSYKKPNIGDWLKGDSKFSELGKESWSIGGQQFDRADMLAYDKFEMKNKWEGHIGEDMKTDTSVDAVKGEVVEKKIPGIKKEELSKAYSISGSTKDIEEEYGAGWSYKKQKAIRKTAKKVERGEKRLERSQDMQQWKEEHGGTVKKGALAAGAVGVAVTNPAIAAGAAGLYGAKKGGEYLYEKGTEYLGDRKKKAHDLKIHNKALANQAWRVGRGEAYEQVIAMSGKPGKDFDKIMGAYELEYGSTEQTKDLKRDRADFIKENPYMKEGTDEEPQPSKFEDMLKNIKEYGGKLNIFKNLTKETDAISEVGEALNNDTSFKESDSAYAPDIIDVGEDAPRPEFKYDPNSDMNYAQQKKLHKTDGISDIKATSEAKRTKLIEPDFSVFDNADTRRLKPQDYEGDDLLNRELEQGFRDDLAFLNHPDAASGKIPEAKRKAAQAQSEKKAYSGGVERAIDYLGKEGGAWAFDETISTEGLQFGFAGATKEDASAGGGGTATFNLYDTRGKSKEIYKNAFTVKLDEKGKATRQMVSMADPFRKWSGMGEMTDMLSGMSLESMQKHMLALVEG